MKNIEFIEENSKFVPNGVSVGLLGRLMVHFYKSISRRDITKNT